MEIKLKIFSVLLGFFVFIIQPIWVLLALIFMICVIDMITALMKDYKNNKIVGFWKKIKEIKSRKMRRTSIKILFYWIIITLFYSIVKICIVHDETAIWAARIATLLMSVHELYSIGENMSGVTSNNIFNKIIRGTVKKLNEKINNMIECDEKK
ncbi:phage holin family protein [Candidatus Dojkabacteria bacterium]|jgi:hypothetical protein|nr:phage holin family protein [Candidatus Dojkabacteria bacterium]